MALQARITMTLLFGYIVAQNMTPTVETHTGISLTLPSLILKKKKKNLNIMVRIDKEIAD